VALKLPKGPLNVSDQKTGVHRGLEGGSASALRDSVNSCGCGLKKPVGDDGSGSGDGKHADAVKPSSGGSPPDGAPGLSTDGVKLLRCVATPSVEQTPDRNSAAYLLKKELLSTRFGRSDPAYESKHLYAAYGPANFAPGSNVELSSLANVIAVGTTVDARIGQSVKLHYIRIKGYWHFYQSGVPGVLQTPDLVPPAVRWWVQLDKIPTVLGTVPSVINTDANPPGNTDAPLSNLGYTLSTDRTCIWTAVHNPLSQGVVELLHDDIFPKLRPEAQQQSVQLPYGAGVTEQICGYTHHFDFKVDLRGRVADYLIGTNNPSINGVSFNFRPSLFTAGTGGSYMQYHYITELCFDDVVEKS